MGAVSFTIAPIADYERAIRKKFKHWRQISSFELSMLEKFKQAIQNNWFADLSDGKRCLLTLIVLNTAVYLLWKIKPLEPFMWKWFTTSFSSGLFIFAFDNFLFLTAPTITS